MFRKMDKKFYVAPELEMIMIDGTELLAGSPGAGLDFDYSAPTSDTPSDDQPTTW